VRGTSAGRCELDPSRCELLRWSVRGVRDGFAVVRGVGGDSAIGARTGFAVTSDVIWVPRLAANHRGGLLHK
jgi:hypothetical protein